MLKILLIASLFVACVMCMHTRMNTHTHTHSSRTGTSRYDSGAVVLLNGAEIPKYSQIIDTQINSASGLQCIGRNGATKVQWLLPNGIILEDGGLIMSSGLRVESDSSLQDENLALLRQDTDIIATFGVFWCKVEYENKTDTFPVWIVNQATPPSVESSSCEFAGIDTVTDTVGIYLTANISDGAPTVVSCQLNSGGRISKLKLFRSVTASASPTESILRAIASVRLNYLPNIVTCTVSNDDGQDTFTCDIQDSNLGTPVINMISPASNDPSTVTVSWDAISDPDGLLDSYKVYVVSADETDYSAFSSVEISGTQAVVRGINPSKGYYITVVAISTATSESNRILLPAVSQSSDISPSQCQPAQGQRIDIRLTRLDDEGLNLCTEGDNDDDMMAITTAALDANGSGFQNCTIVDPRIMKINCAMGMGETTHTPRMGKTKTRKTGTKARKTGTKTGTKTGEDNDNGEITVTGMAVCNPCQESNALQTISMIEPAENTPHAGTKTKSPKTRKTRRAERIVSEGLIIAYGGSGYSVVISTRHSPNNVCGYSSKFKGDSCDCPYQCYPDYVAKCETNVCPCED